MFPSFPLTQERKVAELSVFHKHKSVSEHNVADLDVTFSVRDQVSNINYIFLIFSPLFLIFFPS